MTISTTSSITVQQGNGSNTAWNYTFLIPSASDLVVTVTTIADGTTSVIDPSLYTVTGLGNANGGTVTYPTSGSPLSSAFNISVQRVLPLTQETDLVNQSAFYPDVVESEFDYLTMLIQQMQEQINRALAFPVGASTVSITVLMTDILNAAANATAAAASAAAAAASAASIQALLPLQSANIGAKQVTTAKIADNAVTPLQLANASMAQVTMVNGTIVESHNANAVTFAIKTLAGNDPSASDPVIFIFRDVTAGNGDFTVLTRTTAMSFTISAGSTMGFANATAGRLWLMVFNDSGTLRLAAVNVRSTTSVMGLSAWGIQSATAEGGAGGADSAQVIYCGAAVTSKAFGVIGYATYETGLTTAGNWAASPTRMQLYGFGVPLPGTYIQFQNSASAVQATTSSLTMAVLSSSPSQAITPSSAANVIEVTWNGVFGNNGSVGIFLQISRGNVNATNLIGAADAFNGNSIYLSAALIAYDFPGVSTATTYFLQGAVTGGTLTLNAQAATARNSIFSAKEIMA